MTCRCSGFGLPVSGSWATPPTTMARVARRAEDLGYASLWTFQRVLSPVAGGLEPSLQIFVHDPLAHARLRRCAHRTDRAGDRHHLRALHSACPARQGDDPRSTHPQRRPTDRRARDRLDAGGVRRRRYPLRASRGPRMEEYLQVPGGALDAGSGGVRSASSSRCRGHTPAQTIQLPHPPVLLGGSAPPGSAPRRTTGPRLDQQQQART